MKNNQNSELIIEFTENENGQLAKDLENIIQKELCIVSKSRQSKGKKSSF
jgi:hypothetical protein